MKRDLGVVGLSYAESAYGALRGPQAGSDADAVRRKVHRKAGGGTASSVPGEPPRTSGVESNIKQGG